MAALDAGYDVRASGVTLDRFCGSGITTVNLAAASIMSGMEDLVIAGGTEMMSLTATPIRDGPASWTPATCACAPHPQSHQGVCADAIATLEGIPREALDALALSQPAARRTWPSPSGRFDKSLVPVYKADGTLALDREEFPRPQTTAEGLAQLKPAFAAMADVPLDDQGTTYRG
jgi:acetyl-CoA C-acetyltransferase